MDKEKLSISASGIDGALWRIDDIRERTFDKVSNLSMDELNWHVDGYLNSIGTLLYHIAKVEAGWLFYDVLGEDLRKVEALFPYDDRDENKRLTIIKDMPISEHIDRLHAIRVHLTSTYKAMDNQQYTHLREVPEYFVSPEWVIHHLCQHESEHLGEIMTIHSLYQSKT